MLVAVAFLTDCRDEKKQKQVSDKLALSGFDKQPMGGYVFKYLARSVFTIEDFNYNRQPFDRWYKSFLEENYHTTNSIYFILAPRVISYREEALALEDFIERGNTVFIATNYADALLLDQLHININDDLSALSTQSAFRMRDTRKQLTDSILFHPNQFSFFFYPLQKRIITDTAFSYEVLGLNDFDKPDFVRVKIGKGEAIIMTNVQACTNYFLLTRNNLQYALGAFSYLPQKYSGVYWDDFYRQHPSRTPEDKSIFSALMSITPLRYAVLILLAMAAIWIITNMFRRQRMIPVIQPNINSSKEFTQTIARLYFNKKENRNIGLKMITHLQDHLRNKYYTNYHSINQDFASLLASKTGLPAEKAEALADTIYFVQHNGWIDDATLLKLNAQVQEVMQGKSEEGYRR
jgi:hypothetical protein